MPSDATHLGWAILLFLLLTIGLTISTIYVFSDPTLAAAWRLQETLALISEVYPESQNQSRLMALGREAVMAQLDRYSGYLEPEELNRVNEEFTGSYAGIGIIVVGHEAGLMVMSVREDGPAARAGMRTGDVILRVDSFNTAGLDPYEATFYLRGPEGTSLEVLAARDNFRDTLSFQIKRETLKLIHITYAGLTPGKSLYIRLLDFESGASEEFQAALDSLYLHRSDSIRGIIVDLRGNPGGLLMEALYIANYFLEGGRLIVGVKGRSRWRNVAFNSSGPDITEGLPLAVIVDRGSASSSEIFAGAMKYAGRGIIIGDTTFGKGLVQEFDDFPDGSGLRLTTARYYFEGDVYISNATDSLIDSAAGIAPDYYLRWIEEEPFPLALENSLLLREYAVAFQDEIAGEQGSVLISADWYASFARYCREQGFQYESYLTSLTQETMEMAAFDSIDVETMTLLQRLNTLARQDDNFQFEAYSSYINRRLYQIALEIKYGAGAAYREAILPYRPDIDLAEKIMAGEIEP